MKETFYVTTPIYYVNDVPHIGHAYTTIAADVLARWNRRSGKEVFFLTGTDEHGKKIDEAANKANKSPKEFVDQLIPHFTDAWKLLNISNDKFIRTTDKYHEEAVKTIIKKIQEKGDIYKGFYEGLYCVGCEAFYTEKDVENNTCPIHKKELERVKEESYFFKLSKYQKRLLEFYSAYPSFLSPTKRANEIISRVKQGLNDLSITRTSFNWGIPFPGDEKHVVYVWFDALPNYLSGVGYPRDNYMNFWPADVHIVGKEINWFHSVIWPAMLFSLGIEPPKMVYAHGWLTVNGEKMSKSLNNFITPKQIADKYGVDTFRYHILRDIAFGDDGDFSEASLVERHNSDLADALGNLLQRSIVLSKKNFDFPTSSELEDIDGELIAESQKLNFAHKHIENLEFHKALEVIWAFIRNCNKYLNDTAPWKVKDKSRIATILYNIFESLRLTTAFIEPFMPETAGKISKQLGLEIPSFKDLVFSSDTKGNIGDPEILFSKLSISQSPFSKVNLKVGVIRQVSQHPDADKLYILKVDIGSETRQLVAGIKEFYQPSDILGKHIIVVTNLKPAIIRGVESQGMLLAAEKGKTVKVLEAETSNPGDQVFVEGITPSVSSCVIDEVFSLKLKTKDNKVLFEDSPLKTARGSLTADIEDGAKIR